MSYRKVLLLSLKPAEKTCRHSRSPGNHDCPGKRNHSSTTDDSSVLATAPQARLMKPKPAHASPMAVAFWTTQHARLIWSVFAKSMLRTSSAIVTEPKGMMTKLSASTCIVRVTPGSA